MNSMGRFLITREESSVLKAVAILFVVTEHIGQAFGIGIVNPLGPIGVFLFLFLSGYGLSCSYEKSGRKKYFIKKTIKIYAPYFIAVMLFLVWSLCVSGQFTDLITIGKFLLLISLPQGSYWYLILLFYWYIMFYLLSFIYNKGKILIPLLFASSLFIIFIMRCEHGYIWQFFSFPFGVLSVRYSKRIAAISSKCNMTIVVVTLLIFAAAFAVLKKMPFVEKYELGIADTAFQIGLTLSVGFLMIIIRRFFIKLSLIRSVLLMIGAVSYEIYLSHVIPLDYLKEYHSLSSLALYALGFGVSLLLLIIFDKIVVRRAEKKLIGGKI